MSSNQQESSMDPNQSFFFANYNQIVNLYSAESPQIDKVGAIPMFLDLFLQSLNYLKFIPFHPDETYLDILFQLFIKEFPYLQKEIMDKDIFSQMAKMVIELNPLFISFDFISHIAQINRLIKQQNLRKKFLLEFIWPLVIIEFSTEDICCDYFKFIRILYNQDIEEMCQQFGMREIILQMMTVTKANQLDYVYTGKSEQFITFVKGIFDLGISGQNKKFFVEIIDSVIFFCNNDCSPLLLSQLLKILLKTFQYLSTQQINQIFTNFDSIYNLVILFNMTQSIELKILLIKLFQLIGNKLNTQVKLQDITLSLHNSSELNQQTEYIPLFAQLFDWATDQIVRLIIPESIIVDEDTMIQNMPVFDLIVEYLISGTQQQQCEIIPSIYTLVKQNIFNQNLLARDQIVQNQFSYLLIKYMEYEESEGQWLYDNSLKVITSIQIHGLSHGSIYLLKNFISYLQNNLDQFTSSQKNTLIRNVCVQILHNLTWYDIIFNLSQKNEFSVNPLDNENQLSRGIDKFLLHFLLIITQQEYSTCSNPWFSSFKQSEKFKVHMINIPTNQDKEWVDYKFLPELLKFIAILLSPLHGNIKFEEEQEYSIYTNLDKEKCTKLVTRVFQPIFGNQQGNVNVISIVYQLMSTFGLYIVGSLDESKLDDLRIILRAQNILITTLIIGSTQVNRRQVMCTALIQLHYSLIEVFQDQMPISDQKGSDFFDQLVVQQKIDQLYETIVESLKQFLSVLLEIDQWELVSDIIRLSQPDGPISKLDLISLISSNQISSQLLSEEARSLYQYAPLTVELMEKIMMQTHFVDMVNDCEVPDGLIQKQKIKSFNNPSIRLEQKKNILLHANIQKEL